MENLDEHVELSLLFDFYGELLDEHKRKIFEDYVLNDLSLSEVAEQVGITRQGVHDIIKRCEKKLRKYEEILHLVEKYKTSLEKCEEIKEIANKSETPDHKKIIKLVEEIKKNGI